MNSIDYYNKFADKYFDDTCSIDMQHLYKAFTELLPNGANVLDAGCGSGRDSKYFLSLGYKVEAFDASIELVKRARDFTGIDVKNMLFSELDAKSKYDGIWACSSLLHVPLDELDKIFSLFSNALKSGGVWYLSFKLGQGEKSINGRVFTFMDEENLRKLVEKAPRVFVEKSWVTDDVRKNRDDKWLNALIRKHD